MGAAARAGVGAAAAACGCYPAPARARARTHARPGTRAAGARRSARRGARRRATCAGAGATRGGSASWDDAFPDPTASPAGDAGAGVAATADPPSASLRSFAREAANRGELAGELLFRARAPQPVAFPRRSVRLRLAVLLLRSTYESVSSAEVVSDADFQRFFFLERQSAWQPYLNLYSPSRIDQGDLSDPLYFDYISAAQYLTLARILRDASSGALPLLYERTVYVPPDEEAGTEERWETSVARRNPDLDDAGALQAFIERAVGDTILGHAETDFADAKVTVPPACEDPSLLERERCVYAGAKQILASLVDGGFALKAEVSELEPSTEDVGGATFAVRLEGPCTLWSSQQLRAQQVPLANDLDAFLLAAWARRSGVLLEWNTRVGTSSVERAFRISELTG